MFEQWLRCQLVQGMFSDEIVVVYPLSPATQVNSFFVPKSYVQGEEKEIGKVRVRVIRQDNTTWAVLPTENQETIPVSEGDLDPLECANTAGAR